VVLRGSCVGSLVGGEIPILSQLVVLRTLCDEGGRCACDRSGQVGKAAIVVAESFEGWKNRESWAMYRWLRSDERCARVVGYDSMSIRYALMDHWEQLGRVTPDYARIVKEDVGLVQRVHWKDISDAFYAEFSESSGRRMRLMTVEEAQESLDRVRHARLKEKEPKYPDVQIWGTRTDDFVAETIYRMRRDGFPQEEVTAYLAEVRGRTWEEQARITSEWVMFPWIKADDDQLERFFEFMSPNRQVFDGVVAQRVSWRPHREDPSWDRSDLFALIADQWPIEQVLYPGCFVDLSPSTVFRSVVYVDDDPRAQRFFADRDLVSSELAKRAPRAGAGEQMRFLGLDWAEPLDLPEASMDLLVSLYARPVWENCRRYLKPGGWLLANTDRGDVALAALDPTLQLVGVVLRRDGRHRLVTDGLNRYLIPKRPGRLTAERIRSSGRGIAYTRRAAAYIFQQQ